MNRNEKSALKYKTRSKFALDFRGLSIELCPLTELAEPQLFRANALLLYFLRRTNAPSPDVLRHVMFLSSNVPAHWSAMKPQLPHSQWLILALLDNS
jgi:hypothetical protein